MEKKGFSYPSKCLTLSVKESGGDTTTNSYYEHSIHECNIRQLPYFETLLSERWSSREDQNNELLHFELTPLSSVEDVNTLIESLYQGVPLSPATDPKRAVGVLALVKVLQHDGLVEKALTNIRQITMADGRQKAEVMAMLENYSTLEDAHRMLQTTEVTFDDGAFASAIRGC
jgi:hypothetical protein